MAKRNFTTLISELTEEERKSMEEQVYVLSHCLRQCGSRLRLYGTGEDTSIHLLGDIEPLLGALEEVRRGLIKKHRLPVSGGAQSRNQSGPA
jgi:hypothetical protein